MLERTSALGLVSRFLTGDEDCRLVTDLLKIAAGGVVADRHVTARQFDLLVAHRVVSLIPTTWTIEGHDLATEQSALTAQQMLLMKVAHDVSTQLSSDHIEHRALKGLATASLDYQHESMRTFGDIDLLVPEAELKRALTSLATIGITPIAARQQPAEFIKGWTLETERGIEVDLHYRITHTSPAPPILFDEPCLIDGKPFLALSAALRLFHAAAHVILSSPGSRRISGLADISAIRASHAIDLDEVRELAQQMRCEALIGQALQIERILRDLPVDTLHWEQPSRLELLSYVRSDSNVAAQYFYQFAMFDTWDAKLKFAQELVLPSLRYSTKRRGLVRVARRIQPRRLGGLGPDGEI